MLRPVGENVIVEPILQSDARAAEVKARSGLLLAKPTNSGTNFEGIPNQCRVVALPLKYKGPIKIGRRYVISEKAPKGFKHEGRALFCLQQDQVIAEVKE